MQAYRYCEQIYTRTPCACFSILCEDNVYKSIWRGKKWNHHMFMDMIIGFLPGVLEFDIQLRTSVKCTKGCVHNKSSRALGYMQFEWEYQLVHVECILWNPFSYSNHPSYDKMTDTNENRMMLFLSGWHLVGSDFHY